MARILSEKLSHDRSRNLNRSQSGSGRVNTILAVSAIVGGLAAVEGAGTKVDGHSHRHAERRVVEAWQNGDLRCTADSAQYTFYPGTRFRTTPEANTEEGVPDEGNVAITVQPGEQITANNPVEYEQTGNYNRWLGVTVKGHPSSMASNLEDRLLWVDISGLSNQVDSDGRPFFNKSENSNSLTTPWIDCRVEGNALVAVNSAQTGGNPIAHAELIKTSK